MTPGAVTLVTCNPPVGMPQRGHSFLAVLLAIWVALLGFLYQKFQGQVGYVS